MDLQQENLIPRPPVVVVMGHIDHGKTKLLDYIRMHGGEKAAPGGGEPRSVTEREAGGITQHIGAYEIIHQNRKITFIDTPGHEAFSKMRSRGAKVADIALLLVAADEGVKPQTLEAYEHIKEANIPFIVVINKIDKPEANPEKIKQQLTEKSILLEGWGGNIPNQEVSAKTGKGLPELLDLILLATDVAELKGNPKKLAEGIIIESFLDHQRGQTTTILIKDGVLALSDYLVTEEEVAKIKNMEDFHGEKIISATFSSPVLISGFKKLISPGLPFIAKKLRTDAVKAFEQMLSLKPRRKVGAPTKTSEKTQNFNIVLKTDVGGSKEAMENILSKLNFPEISLKIIKSEVGDINESDIKFAVSTNSALIGFKVFLNPILEELIQKNKIKIISGDVIYDLETKIKEAMSDKLSPEIKKIDLGKLEVLATFQQVPGRQIIGGKVISGKIKKGAKIDVLRQNKKITSGKLSQLQQNKQNTDEVSQGKEAGILLTSQDEFIKINLGDILEVYEEEIIKKKL